MCARSAPQPAGEPAESDTAELFLMLFGMVRILAPYPVIVQTNPAAMHLGLMQHRKDVGSGWMREGDGA